MNTIICFTSGFFMLAFLLATFGALHRRIYWQDRVGLFVFCAFTWFVMAIFLSAYNTVTYQNGATDAITGKVKYQLIKKDSVIHTENWEKIQ